MEQSEKAIMSGLKKQDGMTITELVNDSKLSRSTIRIALAKLEGAQNVVVRQIGMAKLYSLNKGGKRR
ncbi:MAG: DeoR/GlpR family transcriptional regulator of sugar metabolism [Patescibacteria group bacterium]|jgi:DeoR/GlpR family transcriptional regulator of sugar metabolism